MSADDATPSAARARSSGLGCCVSSTLHAAEKLASARSTMSSLASAQLERKRSRRLTARNSSAGAVASNVFARSITKTHAM